MKQTAKTAVIIGAGKIGRGFVGRLLNQSGYDLVVIEIDQRLIDALNARHGYTVHLVDNDVEDQVWVSPVRTAIHAENQTAVAQAIADVSLMITSVGARELAQVAPNVAAGVRRRIELGVETPLDCLLCENLYGAGRIMRTLVKQHLAPAEQVFFDRHVGLVNVVIGCMGPPIPPALRAQDAAAVLAEPYSELDVNRQDFTGPIPEIDGLHACDHFEAYTARKLYIHNCAHAALAYLGYRKGYRYAHDAIADAGLLAHLRAVWQESMAGLVAQYGVERRWLKALADELPRRFANRALGDTLLRLGRDPIRKLGPTDRLVAPARLAEKAGIVPQALAKTIAAALCFDPPNEPIAAELQNRLATKGLDAVLAELCHIQPDEPLAALVGQHYAAFKRV